MTVLLLKPKVSRIGLDVGTSGARAIQLVRTRDTYAIRSVSRTERPARVSEDGANLPDRRIQACVRGADFRGRDVVACVGFDDTEYHLLELPKDVVAQDGENLAQALRWEVAALLNEQNERVETRHWVLPRTTTPGPNLLAAAARVDVLTAFVANCREAGLICRGLDAPAAALSRFGCLLKRWSARSVWGILDLGATQTRLVLCLEDVPVLVRSVGTGGSVWTQRIAEALRISPKAAEVHKCEHGLALQGRGVRDEGADGVPIPELGAILLGALRSELNELAAETQRSYRYVLGCYAGRQAEDLVLVGGGAVMKNLAKYLTSTLGIPVRQASAYLGEESCRLRGASGGGDDIESLALAIGLATGA